MRSNGTKNQTKLLQTIGWVLVILGMFLPVFFIMTAARTLIVTFPLSCLILILGLTIVAGRFPRQRT